LEKIIKRFKMTEYYWKITDKDGKVTEQFVDGKETKFNVDWEKPGAVFKFELIGDRTHTIDLTTGEFNLNGDIYNPAPEGSKNFRLKYRKRHRRSFNMAGAEQGHEISYILSYIVGDKEYTALVSPPTKGRKIEIITPPK